MIPKFLFGCLNTIKRRLLSYSPGKDFASWLILVSRFSLVSLILMIFAGCSRNSPSVTIRSSADPNQVITLSGQQAKDYAARVMEIDLAKMQTPAAREDEIYSKLKELVPFLFATILIAGFAAWWTQSKYVIAIAIAAAGGLGLVFVIGAWLTWIKWGMLAIAVAVVLWRSGIYQRERDKLLGGTNAAAAANTT
jgi:hypothetical protein